MLMSRSRLPRDKTCRSGSENDRFGDRSLQPFIGNDFTNAHRGMARAAKGATKLINSRRRFHEPMTLRKLGASDEELCG